MCVQLSKRAEVDYVNYFTPLKIWSTLSMPILVKLHLSCFNACWMTRQIVRWRCEQMYLLHWLSFYFVNIYFLFIYINFMEFWWGWYVVRHFKILPLTETSTCWRCSESMSIPTGHDSFHPQRRYNRKTMPLLHAVPNCTRLYSILLNICKTTTVCQ